MKIKMDMQKMEKEMGHKDYQIAFPVPSNIVNFDEDDAIMDLRAFHRQETIGLVLEFTTFSYATIAQVYDFIIRKYGYKNYESDTLFENFETFYYEWLAEGTE